MSTLTKRFPLCSLQSAKYLSIHLAPCSWQPKSYLSFPLLVHISVPRTSYPNPFILFFFLHVLTCPILCSPLHFSFLAFALSSPPSMTLNLCTSTSRDTNSPISWQRGLVFHDNLLTNPQLHQIILVKDARIEDWKMFEQGEFLLEPRISLYT